MESTQSLGLRRPQSFEKPTHPPRYPIIGNLLQVKGRPFAQTLLKLSRSYGPLFEMRLPGTRFLVATTHELVEELCDEERFSKVVGGPLKELRRLIGDGLFTADTDSTNWNRAHNILLPAFSMKAMRSYLPAMNAVVSELVAYWRIHGINGVSVSSDFTRMTLDTIALCGFDYRFESFAKSELHPFIDAMNRCLAYSLKRVQKTKVQLWFDRKAEAAFQKDKALLFALVDGIVDRRMASDQSGASDLLALMLEGVDRKTMSRLDAENIRYQLITFLIAGHETTSGLLSFALYFLVNNPLVLRKARLEVDSVLGKEPDKQPELADIIRLKYISQILREAMRLWPTAPGFSRTPLEPTVLGGRYPLEPGDRVLVSLMSLHRDPKVWGPQADRFDPDHFAAERVQARPERAFLPFGTGQRSCIGQNFAMIEATLALGVLLKNFDFEDYEDYTLKIKESITLKPEGFRLKIHPRSFEKTEL